MTQRGVIIGAGNIARSAHLPAYRHDPEIARRLAIVAAVDPRIPAPDFDGLPVYSSLDDVDSEVTFVDVCAPTSAHHGATLDALARGLHVFCEKPVAVTRHEADALADAARRANRVLFPCHQYRYNPAWQQLRRWIDDGAIGRWHLAEFSVYRLEADRGAVAGSAVPWRAQRANSLGGILLDHGSHFLYLVRDMGGMPQSIVAHLSTLGHADYDVEDTAHLVLDYGARAATITLTWAAHQRENRIRFVGDEGSVEWTGGMLRLVRRDGGEESHDFSAQLDKRQYAGWMRSLLNDFADVIERNDVEARLAEIRDVAILLESAYQSSAEGRRISLA